MSVVWFRKKWLFQYESVLSVNQKHAAQQVLSDSKTHDTTDSFLFSESNTYTTTIVSNSRVSDSYKLVLFSESNQQLVQKNRLKSKACDLKSYWFMKSVSLHMVLFSESNT